MRVGVLDYGAGNLRSVLNALAEVGRPADLITKPEDFAAIDLLVFPGQGAFGDSVRQLQAHGLWKPLIDWLKQGRPYLGICLGYQLLFETGEECPGLAGLGIFKGHVGRFPSVPGVKIPHMGWNVARFRDPSHPVWKNLGDESNFYFVHSYFPQPRDAALIGCETDYAGLNFASGIVGKNLVATQFHPEKSQSAGLNLLRNAFTFLGGSH